MKQLQKTQAFAPANISCLFAIYAHDNPRWAGSYGFGFTIDEGVVVTVSHSERRAIYLNKKRVTFPAVSYVVKKLTKKAIKIEITSTLPVGAGFGLSGASALAAAYALNALLKLQKTKKELAVLAHTADVVSKTGLGGVVNQYYGGFVVKLKPSSYFVVKRLQFTGTPIYCKSFSKIATKLVLKNVSAHTLINTAGMSALKRVDLKMKRRRKITLAEMISISRTFAEESGLLIHRKTLETITSIERRGGHASMNMLGNAVYSDIPFPGAMKLIISDTPAHIIK